MKKACSQLTVRWLFVQRERTGICLAVRLVARRRVARREAPGLRVQVDCGRALSTPGLESTFRKATHDSGPGG